MKLLTLSLKSTSLLVSLLITFSGPNLIFSQNSKAFKHVAKQKNTINNYTIIDNPKTNNSKDKILFISHDYSTGPYINSPIGVWYTNKKWSIFKQNRKPLKVNAKFNVLVKSKNDPDAFIHETKKGNISGHITTIDNPRTNNNPDAIIMVTQNWSTTGPYNNNPIGIYYSSGKWRIFNQNKARMPLNAKFNILIGSKNSFRHTASRNTMQMPHVTRLNHTLTNKNTDALIFATQYWSGVYNNHPIGVWYSNGKWTIYNEDRVGMPQSAKFNILALGGGQEEESDHSYSPNLCIPVITEPSRASSPETPECVNCEFRQTTAPLTSVTSKLWKSGRTLRVRLDGGTPLIRSKVIRYAREWTRYANIKFDFIRSGDAEIIVTFGDDGRSWSYLGTDAVDDGIRFIGNFQQQGTMHFGWLTDDCSEEKFRRVILHEFGHALGFTHEQGNPHSNIPWDREKVYQVYADIGWDRNKVDKQVFKKADEGETQYSEYDKNSIMHYHIPNELTIGNYTVPWNTQLSKVDKAYARILYPPATIRGNKIKISVRTGDDDLRENSDASIQVFLSSGSPKTFKVSLNKKKGWGNNKTRTIEIPMPDGVSLGDVERCILKFQSGKQFPWDTPDNWNVDMFKMEWITPDGFKSLLALREAIPYVRFKNTGQKTVYER